MFSKALFFETNNPILNILKQFFFIWILWPFQEYFSYIEPIVYQRRAKTEEPGGKPPDHR